MPRQTKKALRIRGKIQRNAEGEIKYQQGDTARGALHYDKFYGAIKNNNNIHYVIRKRLTELNESDVPKIVDEVVKEKVSQAIAERGLKNAFAEPVWMNKDKNIEIKKVRIFVKSTNPIHLKKHRDLSIKDYKHDYYVKNDENYCIAIYEGSNNKGNAMRSFQIISNLEAARKLRLKSKKNEEDLVPLSDNNDYPLKWILKIGTMVLFYETSPSELVESNIEQLTKRLYKVHGLEADGRVKFQYHQVARKLENSDFSAGQWKQGEDLRIGIRIGYKAIKILIEGIDFELTTTGEIIFK